MERAPERVVAAVSAQPIGFNPDVPDFLYHGNMTNWGRDQVARRPDITMRMVEAFLHTMFRTTGADFVCSVTRDFVRACETPILVLPDDTSGHSYVTAMESAMLAPNSEVSLFPWKEPADRIPVAVRHIRSFMRAHRPETDA